MPVATALEDLHLAIVDLQAQGGRGRIAGLAGITEGEAQALAGFGGHLQPAQGTVIALWPAQHGRTGGRAQALFSCPQRLARGGPDDMDLVQRQPGAGPGRGMRLPRRGDQHHRLLLAQPREGRPDQPQLALARAGQQDLGQGRGGPAAARQAGVQRRMAGGVGGLDRRRARLPAPDLAAGQQVFQGPGRAHQRASREGWNRRGRARNRGMAASIGKDGVKG